jgi:putative membrane protein
MSNRKSPIVIEVDKPSRKKKVTPADAPAVIDVPTGAAMETVTRTVGRKTSRLAKLFWASIMALLGFMISLAFWDFVVNLLARNIWLGRAALVLVAVAVVCLIIFALRELAAISRLRRIDGLRKASDALHHSNDLSAVQAHGERLVRLIKGRPELSWAVANYSEQKRDQLDAPSALALIETQLLQPQDVMAQKEIEHGARIVATATALAPFALLDVFMALGANIRMIRRIAEIYGGRAGSFGSWRLLRAVAGHLVATGAVSIGDDMLGSIAGGGVLSKLSRRFGEGLVNGALTARVGIAAAEVCRPMPYHALQKPKVTSIVKNALTGLVSK